MLPPGCGHVLLAAPRVASSGIWTALSRMRTPACAKSALRRVRAGMLRMQRWCRLCAQCYGASILVPPMVATSGAISTRLGERRC